MADEYFYGVTLKGENSVVTWNPVEKTSEEEMFSESTIHKLIIKQVLLGVEAKADEFNVVEVETNGNDEKVKIPIAVLKVGENRCSQSFLEFPDAPVTFRLIQGSGPVHIHGHHLTAGDDEGEIPMDDDEDLDEEEDDSDNEIKAEEEDEPKPKKQKTAKGKAEKNGKKK